MLHNRNAKPPLGLAGQLSQIRRGGQRLVRPYRSKIQKSHSRAAKNGSSINEEKRDELPLGIGAYVNDTRKRKKEDKHKSPSRTLAKRECS
jgi:hypothetical protein